MPISHDLVFCQSARCKHLVKGFHADLKKNDGVEANLPYLPDLIFDGLIADKLIMRMSRYLIGLAILNFANIKTVNIELFPVQSKNPTFKQIKNGIRPKVG